MLHAHRGATTVPDRHQAVLTASLVLFCAAASAGPASPVPDDPVPSLKPIEPAVPERVPPAAPAVTGEAPRDLVERIRRDVERITGACASCLQLVRDQAMTWSDGSLGCAQPGIDYLQQPVNGYWIVFRHKGREFDYRADDRGQFRLCPARRVARPE